MDEKKDQFKKAKNMFNSLKTDRSIVPFAEKMLDKKLLNLKGLNMRQINRFTLVNLIDNKIFLMKIRLLPEQIMLKNVGLKP